MVVEMSVINSISVKEAVRKIRGFLSEDGDIDISKLAVCQALKNGSDDIKGKVLFTPRQFYALKTMGQNGPKLFDALYPHRDDIPAAYGQYAFESELVDDLMTDLEAATPVAT